MGNNFSLKDIERFNEKMLGKNGKFKNASILNAKNVKEATNKPFGSRIVKKLKKRRKN